MPGRSKSSMKSMTRFTARLSSKNTASGYLVQNPPMPPLTQKELDWVYVAALCPLRITLRMKTKAAYPPFRRWNFPSSHNRGCFGACNFCSIATHQGRQVTCRSEESVLAEAVAMTEKPPLQRLYPRCRRADGEFPESLLRPPAGAWAVPAAESVWRPPPARIWRRITPSIWRYLRQPAGAARGQAGVHPFRHPVRLSAGGQGRDLFQGAGGAPCQRAAEGGAGALLCGGARPDGETPYRNV